MPKNKKNKSTPFEPDEVLKGRQEVAEYYQQVVPEYKDNPLIEALPPIIQHERIIPELAYFPHYSADMRDLPKEIRLHMIDNAREFYLPSARNIELHYAVSNMIRRSYINRNPSDIGYWNEHEKKMMSLETAVKNKPPFRQRLTSRSKPRGSAIIGEGGNGKSSALESELSLYPQVITHTKYGNDDFIMKQLVWIKIDCPGDGSLKSLCLEFFHAVDEVLGTDYSTAYGGRRRTIDDLLMDMARVASMHSLGVLVIDEIQDLIEANGGGAAKMLNFFVHLENKIGVPYVLVGTPKAFDLFTAEFRQARRVSEQGDFFWERMKLISEEDPNQPDEEFDDFIRAMWNYQYTNKVVPLPENILESNVVRAIYNYSQGIPAIVHTLFFLAQVRAITGEVEELTVNVIRYAEKDRLRMIRAKIDEYRVGIEDGTGSTDMTAAKYLAMRRLKRLLNIPQNMLDELLREGYGGASVPPSDSVPNPISDAQEDASAHEPSAPAKDTAAEIVTLDTLAAREKKPKGTPAAKRRKAASGAQLPPATGEPGKSLAADMYAYIRPADEFFTPYADAEKDRKKNTRSQ